jgi:deoxyribodipyrimidine photolyase-like uncharacterized protein
MKFGDNFEKVRLCRSCLEILNDSLMDDLMMEYGSKFYGEYEIPTEDEKEEIAQEKWETDSEDDEKMDIFVKKTSKRIYQICFMNYLYESDQMDEFEIKGKCVLHSMNIDFDPEEVYRWFMELFVDAFDWVMVPNVYGMSQFADGGIMSTKPYISGSNYLMKMSDYPKGDWQGIWDGLFWRFMHTHRTFFLQNPRLGMLVKSFDKMSTEKQQEHLLKAQQCLDSLD